MTKEELKDKIKNKISMALKDPILQIGFECICEENTDLKAYNEKLLDGDIEKHNKIVELEKACHKWFMRWREAKKDALYFDSSLQKQIEATYKVVEKLNEAKELLNEFVGWANWQSGGKCPSFKKIKDKAIDFLKEEEND